MKKASCIWLLSLFAVGSPWVTPVKAATRFEFSRKPESWFASQEALQIGSNVLSWQSTAGSWPKNTDTFTRPFKGERAEIKGTFDNGGTTGELRFLARLSVITREPSFPAAFLKGFDHIVSAQYTNGGWPQSYPPPKGYGRHITFNDNAMVRLMEFVREMATSTNYAFLDADRKQRAKQTFDRGIECILKSQVKVQNKLTAWCAQHDEVDLSPRPARAYELVSLSGSESVGLVRLLMSVEPRTPEIVQSIDAAVQWFERAKLPGIKVVQAKSKDGESDKLVEHDTNAKPIWARFYEIDTNKPFFCGRDGVKKYSLAEIERERRNGYAWLGYWPETLLEKDYPEWRKKSGQ